MEGNYLVGGCHLVGTSYLVSPILLGATQRLPITQGHSLLPVFTKNLKVLKKKG
jgi:hypothetical protein